MKGLLIKDLKLIKNQRVFFIIMAVVCIWIIWKGNGISVGVSYAAAMFSIYAVSTVNYDELDNGMGFLFTLPINRKIYVLEKYILGILMMAAVLAAGSAIMITTAVVKSVPYRPQEWLIVLFSVLLTTSLILSVTLPVQLKFGAEKGRIALLIVVACIAAAGYGAQQAAKAFSIDLAAERFLQAGTAEVVACLGILAVGLLGISYRISVSVMKRKQF